MALADLLPLTNPTSGSTLASPSHAGQHANANDLLELLMARGFDARAYGAAGDGLTDDTSAIQAAIDAAAIAGGTVLLPPGDYRITTVLTLRAGVNIRGMGSQSTTILAVGCSGITYDPTWTSTAENAHNRFVLEDFAIRGDYTAAKVGIHVKNAHYWNINRVQVDRFASHGVHVESCFVATISNSRIADNDGDGLHLGPTPTTTITVLGCEIASNNNAGITLAGQGSPNQWIEGINIIGGAIEANHLCGIDIRDFTSSLSLSGAWLEDNGRALTAPAGRTASSAAVIAYGIRMVDCQNTGIRRLSVTGSVISQGAGSGGTGYGIALGPVHALLVAGNELWDSTLGVYMIPGNEGGIKDARIFANTGEAVVTEQPKAGSSTFNGTTGRTITHTNGLDTTYKVVITPTAALAGRFHVTKAAATFTVYSSDAGDAGAFDWAIVESAT